MASVHITFLLSSQKNSGLLGKPNFGIFEVTKSLSQFIQRFCDVLFFPLSC